MLSLIGMIFLRELCWDSPLLPNLEPNKQRGKKMNKRVKRARDTVSQTGKRWKVGEGYTLSDSGNTPSWECMQLCAMPTCEMLCYPQGLLVSVAQCFIVTMERL